MCVVGVDKWLVEKRVADSRVWLIVQMCVADSTDLCGWQQILCGCSVCYSTHNCAGQRHSNDPTIVSLRLWQVHLLEEYIFTMLALSCDLLLVISFGACDAGIRTVRCIQTGNMDTSPIIHNILVTSKLSLPRILCSTISPSLLHTQIC